MWQRFKVFHTILPIQVFNWGIIEWIPLEKFNNGINFKMLAIFLYILPEPSVRHIKFDKNARNTVLLKNIKKRTRWECEREEVLCVKRENEGDAWGQSPRAALRKLPFQGFPVEVDEQTNEEKFNSNPRNAHRTRQFHSFPFSFSRRPRQCIPTQRFTLTRPRANLTPPTFRHSFSPLSSWLAFFSSLPTLTPPRHSYSLLNPDASSSSWRCVLFISLTLPFFLLCRTLSFYPLRLRYCCTQPSPMPYNRPRKFSSCKISTLITHTVKSPIKTIFERRDLERVLHSRWMNLSIG